MNQAELLTRGTVWLALLCYVAALAFWTRTDSRAHATARALWFGGCISFLAHVAAAFQFYHQWSHALAADDTRQQTVERVGLNFSGGIYFNYLFALMWVADYAGRIFGGRCFSERSRNWRIAFHAFFLFMIFNATVVFGNGWARPAGAIVCAVALVCWWRRAPIPA